MSKQETARVVNEPQDVSRETTTPAERLRRLRVQLEEFRNGAPSRAKR